MATIFLTRWWVPLTYTIAGTKANKSSSTLWLSDKEDNKVFTLEDVTDPSKALIFNWKHVGYYRYDITLHKSGCMPMRHDLAVPSKVMCLNQFE